MNFNTLRILNIIGLVLVLVMNTLANTLPINGMTTGELSDFYPNRFVPAGFTFSIWGIIYGLLIIFIVYQVRPNNQAFVERIGIWFFISCLANAAWIVAWHYQFIWLSLLIMLLILGSLITVYLKLNISLVPLPWPIRIPFSIYLGWITVATIANVTALLVSQSWTGGSLDESTWSGIMIIIAGIIGILVTLRRKDLFYPLVLIWAFFGIYMGQNPVSTLMAIGLIASTLAIISSIGFILVTK